MIHRTSFALLFLAFAGCADAPDPVSGPVGPAHAPGPETTLPTAQPSHRGPLLFTTQPGWVEEQPASTSRRAQYKLPKVEGDPEDGELVVYYFGEQAGTVEANVERWCTQFALPDGGDPRAILLRRRSESNGRVVEEVELAGTYVAETAPGSGVRHDKPGFAMLAAIVSSDHGPYYVKLVGPKATIEHWRASFRAFVSSITQ